MQRRLSHRALFSRRTAAWIHGLDVLPCAPIEVNLPMNSQTSHLAPIRLTRSNVSPFEMSTVGGLRVTSVTRTVVDVARRLHFVEAVVVFDMALHSRKVSTRELRKWIAAHSGYRGIGTLRQAIDFIEPATESPMETRLRMLLVLAGLPRPEVQVSLYDESGSFLGRLDLYYPNKRLAVEYDGATHRDSLTSDNRRQNRLVDAGYRLLRFTAADVLSTPARVVALVRRSLAN